MAQECGQKYKYHYKDRLREKVKSGALLLGDALDKALNHLIVNKDLQTAKQVFEDNLKTNSINNKIVDVYNSPDIVYSDYDYDIDLLDTSKVVEEFGSDFHSKLNFIKSEKKRVGFKNLSTDSRLFYNRLNYLCLKQKGFLFLECYFNEILPKIKKVIAIQKEIELSDGTNALTGFIDFIAEWEDGKTVLFDNKTSSIDYPADSVKTSQQLAIYKEACAQAGITLDAFGYIILYKRLEKGRDRKCPKCGFKPPKSSKFKSCNNEISGQRCGNAWEDVLSLEVRHQVIIDSIPDRTQDIVMENLDTVVKMINNEIFPRNFNACKGAFGLCAYYNLCYNKSEDGLEKVVK